MSIFSEITLSWNGSDHVIAPDRVMGAIHVIEDVITLKELYEAGSKSVIKPARIASAYAAALRYAGARVSDEEVYAGMFVEGGPDAMVHAITALLVMMIPPNLVVAEKTPAGKSGPAAARTSRKPSRQRSASSD